jgi:hypothetical protein
MDEQVWFNDTIFIKLSAPADLSIRCSTKGQPVSTSSPVYKEDLKFNNSTFFRYRAFSSSGDPVGLEILKYFELRPLTIDYAAENLIADSVRWKRTDSWRYPFNDKLRIHISSERSGVIRYETGKNKLTNSSPVYEGPIAIEEDGIVKAGLYIGDTLIGKPWRQHFKKLNSSD